MKALVVVLLAGVLAPWFALAQDKADLNTITRVQVSGDTVEIVGSRKPNFTTFTMTDPPRLVIDVSEAAFSGVPESVPVGGPTMKALQTATFGSGQDSVARVVIAYTQDLEMDISSEGNRLMVRVAASSAGTRVAELPPDTASRPGEAEAGAPATAEEKAAAEAAAAARAARQGQEKLVAEATTAAQDDTQAQQKAAAEATSLAQAERQAQQKAEAEAAARAEAERQAQEKAAAEALAAREAELAQKRQAELAAAEAEKRRQQEAAQAEADKRRQQQEAAQAEADKRRQQQEAARAQAQAAAQEKQRREAEEREQRLAEARAAAEEKKRQQAEERERRRAQARAAAEEKKRRLAEARAERRRPPREPRAEDSEGRRKTMTGVGFQQQASSSRVFIRTSEPVRYSVSEGSGQVVLELEDTRIQRSNNTLPLDTSFFDTAVARVDPAPSSSRTVRVIIKLKEQVPFQTRQEGTLISLDFQRPSRR